MVDISKALSEKKLSFGFRRQLQNYYKGFRASLRVLENGVTFKYNPNAGYVAQALPLRRSISVSDIYFDNGNLARIGTLVHEGTHIGGFMTDGAWTLKNPMGATYFDPGGGFGLSNLVPRNDGFMGSFRWHQIASSYDYWIEHGGTIGNNKMNWGK